MPIIVNKMPPKSSLFHEIIRIARIMKDHEKITIYKTSDRRILGSMNELIFHFRVHCEMEEGLANIDMNKANTQAAGSIMKLNNEYIWPREMLRKIIDHL